MTRSQHAASPSFRGRNLLALTVAAGAWGLVHVNCDPVASGTEPGAVTTTALFPPPLLLPPPPPQAERGGGAAPQTDAAAPTERETAAITAAANTNPDVLTGRWAMLFSVMILKQGCERFERIPDYTATLYKQERIGGELLEGQTVSVKLRHQPFSVYMKWLTGDKGRQVIYVDGQNDGKMLVQLGGIKGRLLGVLSIDPMSSQAMAETRHPITGAGLLGLAQKVLHHRERDLARGTGVQCELHDNQLHNDRPCYVFVTTYDSPEFHETYRKVVLYVDKELSMPVCVRNFTWARDANPETIDEDTLIEYYSYSDIKVEQQLADGDFDKGNAEYKLRR